MLCRRMYSPTHSQQGFVLVIGMILLLIIGIAAFSSMDSTNMEYRMAANLAYKDVSFQASESGRIASGNALKDYVYERSWANVTVHNNLSFDSALDPLSPNGSSEDTFNTDTLSKDMDFSVAESSSTGAVESDVYILRSDSASTAEGAGLQQLSGYRGAGKGAAASGSALYFEIRSKGLSKSGAETVTASEFRALIQ